MTIQSQANLCLISLLVLLFSCSHDSSYREFEQRSNSNHYSNYGNSYQQQNNYQQQNPYVAQPYQSYPQTQYRLSPYQQPGSRYYSNPYAIPPSPYYNTYDSDHYYVPPNSNYGETEHNEGANIAVDELERHW